MLYAEHVAAEALRFMRMKAYAPRRAHSQNFVWLSKLLGFHAA
jgi:hypothetical protein